MVDAVSVHQEGASPPPHPRGVSYKTPIDAAKGRVTVLELAERLASEQGTRLTHHGREWSASCPLPGHEDHSPSFYVNPERNAWFCHSCQLGGDVVRLAQFVWGYPANESHIAAAMLLMEFGYEPPPRPPSWFARQERQKLVRDRAEHGRIEHVRMLVFRLIWVPWLKTLPECVRDEAKESAWKDALWMADRLYASRRSS